MTRRHRNRGLAVNASVFNSPSAASLPAGLPRALVPSVEGAQHGAGQEVRQETRQGAKHHMALKTAEGGTMTGEGAATAGGIAPARWGMLPGLSELGALLRRGDIALAAGVLIIL